MLPFRKILFPVDYSDACRVIVPFAREMRTHFSAELAVVRAYGLGVLDGEIALAEKDVIEGVQRREEQRLREFVEQAFPGDRVEAFLEQGEPGSVIDHVVRHQGADLIMMATHGRGTIRRLLVGSVTAKVLHDVSAAVWTASPAAIESHPRDGYRSIVCAVGLDEEAESVLLAAAALARYYKAQLSLVHVVEIPQANAEVDVTPFLDELVASAEDTLNKWKSTLGINAPHTILEARTADGVCRHAIERQADLIVAGRGRQQGTISRAWAHLYDIVRQAPCPVLSI